jgi:hypothetical protein
MPSISALKRFVLFPLLLTLYGAVALAGGTMNWDDEFIRYYRKLEQNPHAWEKINLLTDSFYVFIESQNDETINLKPNAHWGFKRLHSLGYKTVLNPDTTGAITVILYRNELGQYFIRFSGGCVVYSDKLYGPFKHSEKEFPWPLAKDEIEPGTPVVSPDRDTLSLAIAQNQIEKVRSLIKSHPVVLDQADSQSATALVLAASLNRTEIACLLLEAHADFDRPDARGFTALMYSVINKNEELVRSILRYKPNLAARNKNGQTVMDYVKLLGWEKEFERLMRQK